VLGVALDRRGDASRPDRDELRDAASGLRTYSTVRRASSASTASSSGYASEAAITA
jgi:hypothetical protein